MFSKRSLEGEIRIDHRASPGLTQEQLAGFDAPVVPAGQVFASAIITCSHCQDTVVLNPNRTRERGWCQKCDAYLCDPCEFVRSRTFACQSVERRFDEIQNAIERHGVRPLLLKT